MRTFFLYWYGVALLAASSNASIQSIHPTLDEKAKDLMVQRAYSFFDAVKNHSISLAFIEFDNLRITNEDLSNLNLSRTKFRNCILENVDLTNSNLTNVQLNNVTFINVYLEGSQLSHHFTFNSRLSSFECIALYTILMNLGNRYKIDGVDQAAESFYQKADALEQILIALGLSQKLHSFLSQLHYGISIGNKYYTISSSKSFRLLLNYFVSHQFPFNKDTAMQILNTQELITEKFIYKFGTTPLLVQEAIKMLI